jgi:predicted transcriptional regulator of viral defense system
MEHYSYIMKNKTYAEQILELANRKEIIKLSDLKEMGIPRVVLTRLIRSGQLEKMARGLYCVPNQQVTENTSLITIAIKIPQAIFCLLTALQIHEITTQLPRQIWIAMPRGSHVPKLDYPPIRMIQCSANIYSIGVVTMEYDKQTIRVYSPAKTVVDCFKYRNTIGLDVAIEALKEARAQKKATADELWHFAKIGRVTNVMRPYLEVIE